MGATAGRILEADHRRIDARLERFAESLTGEAVDRAAFDEAAQALRHHIYVEEEFHFPAMREAGLFGPVMVMLREHGEIWDLLDDIAAALGADSLDRAGTAWPQLVEVLQQHNLKEERILYPAGDQVLPADLAADLVAVLESGDSPAGWVCAMAGRG